MGKLIEYHEWADRNGKEYSTVRMAVSKGRIKTATKRGKSLYINEDEPYPDDLRSDAGQKVVRRNAARAACKRVYKIVLEILEKSETKEEAVSAIRAIADLNENEKNETEGETNMKPAEYIQQKKQSIIDAIDALRVEAMTDSVFWRPLADTVYIDPNGVNLTGGVVLGKLFVPDPELDLTDEYEEIADELSEIYATTPERKAEIENASEASSEKYWELLYADEKCRDYVRNAVKDLKGVDDFEDETWKRVVPSEKIVEDFLARCNG